MLYGVLCKKNGGWKISYSSFAEWGWGWGYRYSLTSCKCDINVKVNAF